MSSELTITQAGSAITQDRTSMKSTNSKLNNMQLEIINITPTLNAVAYTVNDIFFQPTKIPNAVAVDGGCALLHSITWLDTQGTGNACELFFHGLDPKTIDGHSFPANDAVVTGGDGDIIFGPSAEFLCSSGNIKQDSTPLFGAGNGQGTSTGTLYSPLQATEGSRDIWVWGLSKTISAVSHTTSSSTFRIAIVKD